MSTLRPEQKSQLDDALLESLLMQLYVGVSNEGQRIERVLASLQSDVSAARAVTNPRQAWARWSSIALAVSVLCAFVYSVAHVTTTNAAYAAVMRSLETTPPTRAYRVQMLHQLPIWGTREVTAELYLNDRDQFVVRHPGWSRFSDLWIGGDANKRWMAPRFGPAYDGVEDSVGGWLARKDILSPYLHVSTVLKRMSRTYRLEMLDNESLPKVDAAGVKVECQHVFGKIRRANKMLPATIELWSDVQTGMARRLVLSWDRSESERGPIQWNIELVGSPKLPDDWFELSGHISADRKVIPIQSTAELEAAEVEAN